MLEGTALRWEGKSLRASCLHSEPGTCLPGLVMAVDMIEAFKRLLDRHITMQEMEGYISQAGRGD